VGNLVGECRGELFSCNPKEKIHGNLEIKDVSRLEFSLLAVHFAGANVSFGDVWSELRGIKFMLRLWIGVNQHAASPKNQRPASVDQKLNC